MAIAVPKETSARIAALRPQVQQAEYSLRSKYSHFAEYWGTSGGLLNLSFTAPRERSSAAPQRPGRSPAPTPQLPRLA